MKKQFRNFTIIWATQFVLFNIITFLSIGWLHNEEFTTAFWIGHLLICIMFVGYLLCARAALGEANARKTFYRIPLIRASYAGLSTSFFAGSLCMLIYELPDWIAVVITAIALSSNIIALTKAGVAVSAVEQVDEKIKQQTMFIKSMTVYADGLLSQAKTEEAKAVCKKVYEAVRYSDPMSSNALSGIESQITIRFSALTEAVRAGQQETISSVAEEILILLKDRNQKCMLLK